MLGARWAQLDPASALAYAKKPGARDVGSAITRGAFVKCLTVAPEIARVWLAALPAGNERNNTVSLAVLTLAHSDLTAAVQFANQLPAGDRRNQALYSLLGAAEMMNDPQLAEQLYAQLPSQGRINIAGTVASRLAVTDVNAALAWASALPEGQARSRALAAATQMWAQNDPAAAVVWVWQNNPPTEKEDSMREPFSTWLKSAPDEALAWALALPAGKTQDELAANGIVHLASTDPRRAAELMKTKLSSDSQSRAADGLATNWAESDPVAAAAWAEQLPESDARGSALMRVTEKWAEADPAAAARWVDRFPPGQRRTIMVIALAGQTLDGDPEGALAWMASIGDADVRAAQINHLAGRWLNDDPAAARKWIAGSVLLSAEQKAGLLKKE